VTVTVTATATAIAREIAIGTGTGTGTEIEIGVVSEIGIVVRESVREIAIETETERGTEIGTGTGTGTGTVIVRETETETETTDGGEIEVYLLAENEGAVARLVDDAEVEAARGMEQGDHYDQDTRMLFDQTTHTISFCIQLVSCVIGLRKASLLRTQAREIITWPAGHTMA
jgi:hypothetical protein